MRKIIKNITTMVLLFIILFSGLCYADEIDPWSNNTQNYGEIEIQSLIIIGLIVVAISAMAIKILKKSKKIEENEKGVEE